MATKSRTRRASRSVVDGTTSLIGFLPGLAAKALKIVESLIGVLNKLVAGANKLVGVVRVKLEELEAFLSAYAKQ